jgi:aminomethyltransferase
MTSISELIPSPAPRSGGPRNPLDRAGIAWHVCDPRDYPPSFGDRPIRYADPGGVLQTIADHCGPPTGICVLADNVAGIWGWTDVSFSDQYRAMTRGAGAFPCGGMYYMQISGPGAARLLDMLTPRDVSQLAVGRATFVIFTTPSGTVDTEAVALRTGADEYLLSVGGSARPPTWLASATALMPETVVSEAELTSFNLKGPRQVAAMAHLVRPDDRPLVERLSPFGVCAVHTTFDGPAWIVRTSIGTEMWAAPEVISAVWGHMLARRDLFTPCGWDALATFRVECAAMVFGLCPLDLHDETTLSEVGQEPMVNADKTSDYVGRSSLLEPGPPPRLWLAGIEPVEDRDQPPRVGSTLSNGDRVIGFVTTGAYSPSRGRALGFAHLRPDCHAGRTVRLDDGSAWTARPLPFG